MQKQLFSSIKKLLPLGFSSNLPQFPSILFRSPRFLAVLRGSAPSREPQLHALSYGTDCPLATPLFDAGGVRVSV